jgi:hypothetical protein
MKMSIDYSIKKAYLRFKRAMQLNRKNACLSDEDIACFLDNKLGKNDKTRVLDHIVKCQECSEVIKDNYALQDILNDTTIPDPPGYLTAQAKAMVGSLVESNILNIVLQFKQNIINVIETTGQIMRGYNNYNNVPAFAFRSGQQSPDKETNEVKINKKISNLDIDVEIEKQKPETANIIVRVVDEASKKKIDGVRISLMKDNREIESSLAEEGKVRFEEVKLHNHKIILTQDNKELGVVNILIRPSK